MFDRLLRPFCASVAICGVVAGLSGCPSIRGEFAKLNYPERDPGAPRAPSVAPSLHVLTAARVVPLLAVGFEQPRVVAQWLRDHLARRSNDARALAELQRGAVIIDDPNATPALVLHDFAALTPYDRTRLSIALEDASKALALFLLQACQNRAPTAVSIVNTSPSNDVLTACGRWSERTVGERAPTALWQHAIARAADVVAHQGRTPSLVASRLDRPTLALSGGSGNGAFTAGYLYALLYANAVAIERANGAIQAARHPRDDRFGAVVGTSVGALLGGVLEAWHAPAGASPPPAQLPARLTRQLSESGAPERLARDAHAREQRRVAAIASSAISPWQRVALDMTRSLLAGSWEGDVLCARNAGMLAPIVGAPGNPVTGDPIDSLLRFDPLEQTMTEYFRLFRAHARSNDLWRESMAVDLQFNVTAALNEGACDAPAGRVACESRNILASASLPMFVPPVPLIRAELADDGVQAGMWFDGGLRSGTPSFRALLLGGVRTDRAAPTGRGRVLAINTHRIAGARHAPSRFDTGFGILVSTVGGPMTEEVREAELAQSNLYGRSLPERFCARGESLGAACPAPNPRNLPQGTAGTRNDAVFSVFVPGGVDERVVAGGYTFDPVVLTGLFYAGVDAFISSFFSARETVTNSAVLEYIGWGSTNAAARGDLVSNGSKLRALRADAKSYLSALVTAMNDAAWQEHVGRSRQRVERDLELCR